MTEMSIVQFSQKKHKNNRSYHQIMKFCDSRTRFRLTGDRKHVENDVCKSFYGMPEISDYFVLPPSYETRCTTSLHEGEKYYNIENIKWLIITQINNNPTTTDKQDESILQHIPEQNSIPILFKPKIENENTSNEENDNKIIQQYSLYNLCYIKKIQLLNIKISIRYI